MSVSLAPTRIKLLDTVTSTAAGVSLPINVVGREDLAFAFESVGTTSGGTLKIEEAFYDETAGVYSGTWSQIGTDISASAFTGGAQLVVHISPNAYDHVRVRISSAITGGGTVTVWFKMQ